MKRTILMSFSVMVLLSVSSVAQGQRPAGAGVGVPPSAGSSLEHRPSNPGKPESPGVSVDHRSGASATHAVDPNNTHGFKNYGQYLAAQHVAENLKIEGGIDALKILMTGDNAVSLGKAIEQLRPALGKPARDGEVKKAEAAAKRAEAEAKKGGKSNQ